MTIKIELKIYDTTLKNKYYSEFAFETGGPHNNNIKNGML